MVRGLTLEEVRRRVSCEGYILHSTEYVDAHHRLSLECNKGHKYEATWGGFQQGTRCPRCSLQKSKKDFNEVQQYIEQYGCVLISKEYKNTHTKLEIRCSQGHLFKITFADFQQGYRCGYCAGRYKTQEEVVSKAKEEGYTLLSTYKKAWGRIEMSCPMGHKFETTWAAFSSTGCRCPFCAGKRRTTQDVERFVQEQGYYLVSGTYKNIHSKFILSCPKGHKLETSWKHFQQGTRCVLCIREQQRDELISSQLTLELNTRGYKLLSTYKNSHEKMLLQCSKGHTFKMDWSDFSQGHGCSVCSHVQSKGEREVVDLFRFLNPLEKDRKTFHNVFELDLHFQQQKVAVEYCGLYWHSDQHERITPDYHNRKLELCNKQGIRLFTLFEDEWRDHKDICISRINEALSLTQDKILAKDCEAKQISHTEAYEFLKQISFNPEPCKIAFGLFSNENLVQVITLNGKKGALEIGFLGGKLNTILVGGTSKLFELSVQYAKEKHFRVIRTYCDLRWENGDIYKQLGFSNTHNSKYKSFYTNGQERWKDRPAQKKKLHKIYDCGHQTWEYKVKE